MKLTTHDLLALIILLTISVILVIAYLRNWIILLERKIAKSDKEAATRKGWVCTLPKEHTSAEVETLKYHPPTDWLGANIPGSHSCTTCSGSGRIVVLNDSKPPYVQECPDCKGSGVKKGWVTNAPIQSKNAEAKKIMYLVTVQDIDSEHNIVRRSDFPKFKDLVKRIKELDHETTLVIDSGFDKHLHKELEEFCKEENMLYANISVS